VDAWTTPTLEGGIVRLEPLARGHLDDLWEASRDPAVWTWLPIAQPRDLAALEAWLDEALTGPYLPLATIVRSTGRATGSTRFLALRPEHRSVEIGWTWLASSVWGSGANVEAKLLQLGHAFETWGCRRVELKTDALNVRSRAAIEALGASFEGVHRKHMLVRDGVNRDSAWYSILDDEWPDVRSRLERRLSKVERGS
jgi:RimJ/RimL family protein N-acetyltransferase